MTRSWRSGAREARSALLLALCTLVLASCAAFPGSTAPVVRIGLVAPFEGHHREIGYDVIYAGRLAIREWNGRGGVEGYRVELVALDDGGDPELARQAARSLALDPMVMGVVGHWLEETTAAARATYRESALPLIEMSATDDRAGELPASFVERYQAVTPFDESAGRHALPAYDACNQLIAAIGAAVAAEGKPGRAGVARALAD